MEQNLVQSKRVKLTDPPQAGAGITIYRHLSPAKTTEVYNTYWKFAAARQEVYFKRIMGDLPPWTHDSILNKHRFTNVYRASDRVSQYLIRNVIYNDYLPNTSEEVFFRVLLFKLFNKIETWELLTSSLGELTYESYKFEHYKGVLDYALCRKKTIYSAAYIMPSGGSTFGYARKHENHLKLIELMMSERVVDRLAEAKTMQQAFEILKSFPTLGDFLAYQLLIDINYSEIINFSESEFVVPGPGAKGGISKCFWDTGGLSDSEIIKLVTDRQVQEFDRLGLSFKSLWGRNMQLIDCQNLFCEVDKYARVKHPEIKGSSDRTRIKQVFRASSAPISVWFPPKWGINQNIGLSAACKQIQSI